MPATPLIDLPILKDRERSFQHDEVLPRVRKWASSDGSGDKDKIDWAKYEKAWFWCDPANEENFKGYKLPFCDVVNGELTAIPRGIFAVAAVLQGSRGGVDIPDKDRAAVKAHVQHYYERLAKLFDDKTIVAPWAKDEAMTDSARLKRSFSEIAQLVTAAAMVSSAFCPGHAMGFQQPSAVNGSLFVYDLSPTDVVMGCWVCGDLYEAPYAISKDDAVTFGKGQVVQERFVPAGAEELTDSLSIGDDEIEFLDADQHHGPRIRMLSSKANTVINQRVYPMPILRPAVSDLKRRIQAGAIWSECPHPEKIVRDGKVIGFKTNESRRVSRITNVEINDKGEVWTEHEFRRAPQALAIYDSLKAREGVYGISQRAIGKTEQRALSGQTLPTASTIYIDAYDFVQNPALAKTLSEFEVLLDSELQEPVVRAISPPIPEPVALPPPTQVSLEALQGAFSLLDAAVAVSPPTDAAKEHPMPEPILTAAPVAAATPATSAAPVVQITPPPAPLAPALTPEQATALAGLPAVLASVQAAQEIISRDADRQAKKAAKAEVKEFCHSNDVQAALAGLPEAIHPQILQRVRACDDIESATRVLAEEVDSMGRMMSVAKLASVGFGQPAAGAVGSTTSTLAHTVDVGGVHVGNGPTPHLEVARRFTEAYDRHARTVNTNYHVDPGLRETNKYFVEQFIENQHKIHGQALLDSAEALLSGNGNWETFTDSSSVTTSNLWNQPTISTVLFIQQFQDLVFLQWCDGMGPENFEQRKFGAKIGSILRVPVELYIPPANSLALPGYDNGLFVSEDAEVPEASIDTNWLEFAAAWRRIAVSITKDVATALKNGPLNYDAMVRATYHMLEDKKRRTDSGLAAEMLQIADEYADVAVTNEAVVVGNLIQNTGANLLYGNTVLWYANLIGAGTSAAPNHDPVVRPRTVSTLSAQGQISTSTNSPVTVSVPAAQVAGYLDGNNQIQSLPGTTATFAVDYNNGRVCFNAASTVTNSVLPTISYTYVTNYDTFSPTVPAGMQNTDYYVQLLEQIDSTAALMASYPRFRAPNLCLGSYGAMVKVLNAKTFWKIASPAGSKLNAKVTNNFVAERNGVNYGRHNSPWSAGDGRLLLTQQGSTKYGVDRPFEIEGPFPVQGPSGGIIDSKRLLGSEHSVIATPQVTDQAGAVINPVSRSIYFR